MYVKIHKSYRTVVAVCDSDLIGKRFEEQAPKGTKQLNITENFYKGDEVDSKKALEILKFQSKEDATFNIAGEESIKTAIEAEIISEGGIGRIQNIPYALVLL